MDDFPWIYVAMIFIAFVSWLHRRVQEAAAARRLRAGERRAAAEAARRERPLPGGAAPSPYLAPERAPAPPAAPATPPPLPRRAPPSEEIPVPRSFRELFEMLSESRPPVPPHAEPVAPPPLPAANPPAAAAKPAAPRAPVPAPVVASALRPTPAGFGLTKALRRRGPLRQAILLKEILDAPVALR